jgi:hypothetical protein
MAEADRVAGALERGCIDAAEAAVLAGSVGTLFDAVVVGVGERRGGGAVQLLDPPVLAHCDGDLELGARVRGELTVADVLSRTVTFRLAGGSARRGRSRGSVRGRSSTS